MFDENDSSEKIVLVKKFESDAKKIKFILKNGIVNLH